jgi:hypothetical protein
MSTRLKFWVAGAVVIIIGLVMVRVLAGMYSAQPVTQLVIYFIGVILALAGLGIILAGIRVGK